MTLKIRLSRYTRIALITFATCLPFMASAESASEIAGEYEISQIKIKLCREIYKLGSLEAQSGEKSIQNAYKDYLSCQEESIQTIKSTYSRLMPKLKKPAARNALKDLQVALMSAIKFSEPKDNELKIHYQQRMAALDQQVEQALQRLLLEI